MTKTIFGYGLKGTEKQLAEMYDLLNYEDYTSARFQKYFYVWVNEGTGVYFFPKERYFDNFNGTTHYALALFYYGTRKAVHETMHTSEYERNYF